MSSPSDFCVQPSSHGRRIGARQSLYAIFGGPLAWFLQLCAGYALASGPCFRGGARLSAPMPALEWTRVAMVLAMLAAVVVALLACLMSWRTFHRTGRESLGESGVAENRALGRKRFLAHWGVLFGAAFALATAMTAIAFLTLPRCA